MPDKAIDLVDEAGSRARLKASMLPPEIKAKEKEFQDLSAQKEEAINNQEYEEASSLKEKADALKAELAKMREDWNKKRSENKTTVTEEDIAVVASKWTGIPVTKLISSMLSISPIVLIVYL